MNQERIDDMSAIWCIDGNLLFTALYYDRIW